MNKARRNKLFADYKQDSQNWITMANGDFYPDILPDACELYKPVLVMFGQFLKSSESSERTGSGKHSDLRLYLGYRG